MIYDPSGYVSFSGSVTSSELHLTTLDLTNSSQCAALLGSNTDRSLRPIGGSLPAQWSVASRCAANDLLFKDSPSQDEFKSLVDGSRWLNGGLRTAQ